MKKVLTTAIVLLSALAAYAETISQPAALYCSQLIPDLKFIHQQLAENSANVRYSTETGRQAADNCQGETDYIRGIKRYVATYHDPHLTVNFNPSRLKGTGLEIRKINDRYFVSDKFTGMTSPGKVQPGDELISCGAKPPLTILKNEILPFEPYFNEEAALYRYSRTAWSMRFDVNCGDELSCQFLRGGNTFEAKLRWQPVPGAAFLKLKKSYRGPIYKLERIDGVPWITLASFAPENPEDSSLLVEFVEEAKKLRGEKKIVLDLRHNGGGNSYWGERWLKNLIGYAPEPGGKALIWTSKDNAGFYESFKNKYTAEGGLTPQEKNDWEDYIKCIKSRPDTFLECDSKLEHPRTETAQPTEFKGRIILLTDAGCFSSCEDFTLRLRLTGFMTQAGIATDASTTFGEIRARVKTPSGFASLNFPQKVFLIEGMGQGPHRPDIRIDYNVDEEVKGIDSIKAAALKMLRDGRL